MIKKTLLALLILTATFSVKAANSGLFPEIAGWKIQEDPRVYNSGDLWELINGAADIFLSYYFQDLHVAEYSNKDQLIRVELYRHSTLANTYGIYTAERMPDYPQVRMGAQGYKSQGVLNFMTGNYYVKVMSAGLTEADENTIAQVAEKVNAKLAQPAGLPEEISLLPATGRVYLSDAYIAQNFLGYSFFRAAFTAKYGEQGEVQLFIIRLTPAEIEKMIEQYTTTIKEDRVQQKNGFFVFDDPFNGPVYLKHKGNVLAGVLNAGDETTALDLINKATETLP